MNDMHVYELLYKVNSLLDGFLMTVESLCFVLFIDLLKEELSDLMVHLDV